MSYTHVIIKMKAKEKKQPTYHVETDLNEDFVLENIVKPYVNGTTIFVDGSRLSAGDIEKISVHSSDKVGKELLESANRLAEQRAANAAMNGVIGFGGSVTMLYAVQGEETEEITRRLFNQAQNL